VDSAKGLACFRVHEEMDRVHRKAWRDWLKESGDAKEDLDGTVASASRALKPLWGASDPVLEAPL
jgi:hypothetical protein